MTAARVRLTIDVTDTLASGGWTGIQRVVRKLAAELEGATAARGWELRVAAALNGRFHLLGERAMVQLLAPTPDVASVAPPESSGVRRLAALLKSVPAIFVRLHGGFFQRRYARRLRGLLASEPLSFSREDVVLVADPAWRGTTAIGAARRARAKGATIVSVIYDMIPVDHPALMTETIRTIFPRRMRQLLRSSDGAITISRDCAGRVRAFLGGDLPALPLIPVHLGSDVASTPAPARTAPRGGSGFVMVGTIEPRKGHATVLDAFERLWATGDDSPLTFIGKLGWAHPALIARCRNHRENGRKLHLIHDAGDDRLLELLAGAEAAIVASSVEGFGLPVVEALTAGVPVLASDIPVFREIGGEAIGYFASGDAGSLLDAIARLRATPELWRKARDFSWPTWRETAAAMLDAIVAIRSGTTLPGRTELAAG